MNPVKQHVEDLFAKDPYPATFDRVVALKQHREQFEAKVAAGHVSLDELFAAGDVDESISATKVLGLVEAMPDFAKVQTRRAFEDLGISEAAHVGQVTKAQRLELRAALEKHTR